MDVKVRDLRVATWCWQEKEALRLMRDYYTGHMLVAMRSFYLALTEIVSDHGRQSDIRTAELRGGMRAICTYSGLTYETAVKAREKLKQLLSLIHI